ncbi:metal-dependent hydrolase [Microbispora sp. NPDC049125]|uniref:metal-dependent hydrolase n=1 Tax=Microbispora sp. NPDC049125 TaxID=3154929 RepID=UPI0034652BC1
MLGRTHAATGAAAFVAWGAAAHYDLRPLAAGALVAAGAAMLNDLDCPGSHASRAYGLITQALSRGVCAISGGHRYGTHSGVGVGAVAALVYAAAALYSRDANLFHQGWVVSSILISTGILGGLIFPRRPHRGAGRPNLFALGAVAAALAFFGFTHPQTAAQVPYSAPSSA